MKKSTGENSTEKLLDAIRGAGGKSSEMNVSTASSKLSQFVNLKTVQGKTLNLGIFISNRDITFVLTIEKGRSQRKFLIKWAVVKLSENFNIEDEGYAAFLELNLNEFTEGCKDIPIWCTIDSTHVNFRNILIPDIVQSKVANAAFWGLKKEIDFDAEEEIFDFKVTGSIKSEGLKKKNIFALTAKKEQVQKLQAIFLKTGHKLKGITAIPFALQNYIHTHHLQIADAPFTIVNLSRINSELYCFSDSGILLARKVRSDLYDLLESIAGSSDQDIAKSFSSIEDFHSDAFSPIRQSCERLFNKIVRTSEYCSQKFIDSTPMKKFIVFGETVDSESFIDLMKKNIPAGVEKFEPVFDNLPGTIEVGLPQNAAEKNKVILAFGIALSSNTYTPNFIHTYLNKLKKIKERKINIAAAIVFISLFLACAMVSNWQQTTENREIVELNTLIQRKNSFNSEINSKTTLKLILKAKTKLNLMEQYVSAYLPLAVINEIFSLTPRDILISSFESNFNIPGKKDAKKRLKSKAVVAKIILAASILPQENNIESNLTQYILQLEDSQLFENINVLQKSIVKKNQGGARLNFKLTMDVL